MHRSTITITIDSDDVKNKHHLKVGATAEAYGNTRIITEGDYPIFSEAIAASIDSLIEMHTTLGEN